MAEPLKNQFAEDIPEAIASMLSEAGLAFDKRAFVTACLNNYPALELTQRARQIAEQLKTILPDDFEPASTLIIQSLGPKLASSDAFGMTPFLYLPFVYYAAENGLDNFEAAMNLQYELTQRFTAEFSIRYFLVTHPQLTLERLKRWTADPSEHVRRLVSEGTRPLLPWAMRLNQYRKNPEPVISLLEILKDDPSLYVRRSVANNLNDISKDHPERVNALAKAWLSDADENRRWLIKHALRTLVKKGNKTTLSILGFENIGKVALLKPHITPASAPIGSEVHFSFTLHNKNTSNVKIMLDYAIDYIKANGKSSQKVFKFKTLELAADEQAEFNKSISLKQLTTRKHYPGEHNVKLLLNGNLFNLGSFNVTD